MTETLALTLRVGLSFTFVLALMWLAARLLRGKISGRSAGIVEVMARQQVGRGASVAVVRVADRALVVGVTEHGVSMLGEPIADLSTLVDPTEPVALAGPAVPSARRAALDSTTLVNGQKTALSGSILSPGTWRQALHVLRERTVRR